MLLLLLLLLLLPRPLGFADAAAVAVSCDDVHSLTCEVHNTDAEGRFVVGDGCSYLARELGVKTLIDSATLTGHSSFTGSNHCAMMTNDAV